MRPTFFVFAATAALLLFNQGCSQPQEADAVQSEAAGERLVPIDRATVFSESGEKKTTATLAVGGMGCAMACGSKISSALAALDGVDNPDVSFIGAGEDNSVTVEFDASKVTEEEMINAVNGMKGGHYEVKRVMVTEYMSKSEPSDAEGGEVKKDKIGAITPKLRYELPDIFGVFSRLF